MDYRKAVAKETPCNPLRLTSQRGAGLRESLIPVDEIPVFPFARESSPLTIAIQAVL